MAGLSTRRELRSALRPDPPALHFGLYPPIRPDDRAPVDDPAARAVLFGVGLQQTMAHLLRAALEGVSFAIREVYEVTIAQGGSARATVTVGGQAQVHSGIRSRPMCWVCRCWFPLWSKRERLALPALPL